MKRYKFTLLVLFALILSCNNESVDDDPQNITPPEEDQDDRSSTPCAFNLSNLNQGDVITIDCLLDLGGQTVNIPNNVTLEFDGGDIINGTLNFAANGKIDTRLLNLSLKINGEATVIANNFIFIPSRWDIVQGAINGEIAFKNHENIQEAVDLVKRLTPIANFERTNFSISRMDAFFESNSGGDFQVMEIPSNFNLIMSDETVLRVFSVNDPRSTSKIIRLVGVTNISVKGGKLIGDRLERIQPRVGSVLFDIKGGQNILVENVSMTLGSVTGLTINSVGRKGNPIADGTDYFPSKNIIVRNCFFDSNRSNNLSITDGEDITVENCQLFRVGNTIGESTGEAPRIGIVIEPVQGQVVERITIRDNEVREGQGISILAAFGNDFLITGNTTDGGVGWNGASNVRIIDNPSIGGVSAGDDNGFNLSQSTGNVVKNNVIRNAPTGIRATNDDVIIEDNQIINCKVGMQLANLKDSQVRNNTITSNVEDSFGINSQIRVDNVLVTGNTVTLENGRAFALGGINDDEVITLVIEDNTFDCGKTGRITFSKGINIINNTFLKTGFGITSSSRIRVIGNNITNTRDNFNAFFINNSLAVDDIQVLDNFIESRAERGSNAIRLHLSGSVDENTLRNSATNILVRNNRFKVVGNNFAVNSVNFNGVKIENNKIEIEEDACCNQAIFFRGDNSFLTGNTDFSGNPLQKTDIIGNNNIIN